MVGSQVHESHMSQIMSSTSSVAIPAINAKDSNVNVVGGNQTIITNNYNVDPNCDQGIGTITVPRLSSSLSRQDLPVVIGRHPIYKLSRSSKGPSEGHRFMVHQWGTIRTVEGSG